MPLPPSFLLLGSLVVASPLPPQAPSGPLEEKAPAFEEPIGSILPEDEHIRAAWELLTRRDRRDVSEWFQSRVARLDTFQNILIGYVLMLEDRDPGTYPRAEPPPVYDPARHAPGQPIARRWLDTDSSRAARLRERFREAVPERRLDAAFRYDWRLRRIERFADDRDPERVFRNALEGLPPGVDLVEALVEQSLDDGVEQVTLAAFGHAYTDRSGNAYPGLTLYDAWASGTSMEMPDVDTLGIVHDVMDEWRRWVAPVSNQGSLYDTVGELYTRAHRYRGLRTALARSFAIGSGALRDGYRSHLDRFHALWEEHASTPSALTGTLPDSEGWERYLEKLAKRIDQDGALAAAGLNRRVALDYDAWRVKALLVAVMRDLGAFERLAARAPVAGEPAPATISPPAPERGQSGL